MTAFRVLLAFSSVVQPLHDIAARNFALNIDRTIYVTATYIIFRKESRGKSLQSGQNVVSLHRQSKERLMCLKTVIYDDRGGG